LERLDFIIANTSLSLTPIFIAFPIQAEWKRATTD